MNKKEVDVRGQLRFMNDEPYYPTSDTLEYETEESIKDRREKESKSTVPSELTKPRVPKTDEEKEKAKQAEAFLKRLGV